MFMVIIVIKHPNSLQISPPSFITFLESFLTHLMVYGACTWVCRCMHLCMHMCQSELFLSRSPLPYCLQMGSLSPTQNSLFPPADWPRKVLGSAHLLPGLQTHTAMPGFFCGVWVRSPCMQSRHSDHRNISLAPSINFFAFFYSLVSCLKEFFLPTF